MSDNQNEVTLVGLTVDEAKEVLKSFGHTNVRVLDWLQTERITTGDLGADRVTLIVQDGVVIDSYRG